MSVFERAIRFVVMSFVYSLVVKVNAESESLYMLYQESKGMRKQTSNQPTSK